MNFKKLFKPKYIARVKIEKPNSKKKNNWRYFYTREAYDAYLKGKKNVNEASDKISNLLNKGKSFTDNFFKNAKKNTNKISNNISKEISDTKKDISNASKKISKEISDIKKDVSKKVSKELYDTKKDISNLSKTISKKVSKEFYDTKKDISKLSKKISKEVTKEVSDAKKGISKVIKKAEKSIEKGIEKTTFGAKEVKKTIGKMADTGVDKLETIKDRAVNIGKTSVNMAVATLGNEKLTKYVQQKLDDASQSIKKFDDLKTKKDKQTDEEDMAEVNQNYKTNMYEYTNNCAYCTMAYEMRQRGYDVEANPVGPQTANTIDEICNWYKDEDPYTVTVDAADPLYSAQAVEEFLLEYGDGARGQFCTLWTDGGGHSIAWEVVDNDVVLRDCQTNETVDVIDYLQYSSEATFFRTDDLELTEEALKCIRNR